MSYEEEVDLFTFGYNHKGTITSQNELHEFLMHHPVYQELCLFEEMNDWMDRNGELEQVTEHYLDQRKCRINLYFNSGRNINATMLSH